MTTPAPKRPHFRHPPIFEQAISLNFERIRDFGIADPGLFYNVIREQFPVVETGPRMQFSTELFEGQASSSTITVTPGMQLPRAIFRNISSGELIQFQDDSFVFNWVRPRPEAEYPRFEITSARLWELFGLWSDFMRDQHETRIRLRQCELTNVNVIPVSDFGDDFDDMNRAFKVDPFEWNVEGLVAETYIRKRVHRMVAADGRPIGRLHSVITPVFGDTGEKTFHFELTARSAPNITTEEEARLFFDCAHSTINGAFLASVTDNMRALWGEEDGQ
jgi:uncharacterized protein (TIGR04255 family)